MTKEIRKEIRAINTSQRGPHFGIVRVLNMICDKIDEIQGAKEQDKKS